MTHNAFCLRNFILLSILLLLVTDYNTNLLSATPATGSKDGGNLIWVKHAGGPGYDECSGITTLSDNSTVVVGGFADSATFGEGETNQTVLTSTGSEDIFVARYNPDGTLAWAKSAGGGKKDKGTEVVKLSDNSTVVIGFFQFSATFGPGEANETILTSAGVYGSFIFISRYNPDGTLAWAKRVGGSVENEVGCGITALSDNSTVMIGLFNNSVTFGKGEVKQTTLTSRGMNDIFIARYDPDGTLAWAKRAGGSDSDSSKGIKTLSDNSLVVTGWFNSTATFGPSEANETVLTSSGDEDIFIARYKSNGTLIWAKRSGGSNFDISKGITTLSDNSTVVVGSFNGSSIFGPGDTNQTVLISLSKSDTFIARYNPDGTLAWAKCLGGASDYWSSDITTLSDNSTVISGCFGGTATFGPGEVNETVLTATGAWDIFIARYNPDGSLVWVKRAGGLDYDQSNGITTLSDDSTVVTGWYYTKSTFGPGESLQTVLTYFGDRDIFIARFAP